MAKKIAITGTHGVGKTTMAMQMASEIKSGDPSLRVNVLPEAARMCPFPLNKKTTEEAQRWIYHKHMELEIGMAAQCDVLVCDRMALDSLAYSQRAGLCAIVLDYLPGALAWLETYDEIHWLRPNGIDPVDDGVRDPDPEFQRRIDEILSVWFSGTQTLDKKIRLVRL